MAARGMKQTPWAKSARRSAATWREVGTGASLERYPCARLSDRSITVAGATKQYPRRCAVAMYCRVALGLTQGPANPRMQPFRTPSVTTVSGQTVSKSASLVTT